MESGTAMNLKYFTIATAAPTQTTMMALFAAQTISPRFQRRVPVAPGFICDAISSCSVSRFADIAATNSSKEISLSLFSSICANIVSSCSAVVSICSSLSRSLNCFCPR